MLVLHTAHSYFPEVSGVSNVVEQISKKLVGKGHQIYIATGRPSNTPKFEVKDGIKIYRFGVDGNSVFKMNGETENYINFVMSKNWDIIVMHCAQTWTTDLLIPLLPRITSKKIFVGHGFSALEDERYRNYFNDLANAFKSLDKVVTLSPMLEEKTFCLKHNLPQPDVIPNGVDLDLFSGPELRVRNKWDINKDSWVISVSNHSPVKGHDRFFSVVNLLKKNHHNLRGTIIGNSYSAAKWGTGKVGVRGGCWYRCRLKTLNPGSCVSLKWNVPREEVVSSFLEADLMLVTSSREASPLVVLESMCAGLPWISFDVGCMKEHPGGIVVENIGEMVEKADYLLKNHDVRLAIGKEGKNAVINLSWANIASRYEKLYFDIMKNQ